MRLIDADVLKEKLAEKIAMAFCNGKSREFVVNLVNEMIDGMPTQNNICEVRDKCVFGRNSE
ncbi:MAG: hypothetical protein KBT03_12090 [Bacteroidales bacterium]|nr:hypothetical protein [Candidatus Scybalousia scybalohippi]